jgi:hypothetical protein
MEITLGKEGLEMSWQDKFPEVTECCRCGEESRIGFVAHEAMSKEDEAVYPRDFKQFVCDLHKNEGGNGGDYWLHDCCAVAVYFCKDCLDTTALYNQG